jgi:hypothetical protein
VSGNAREWEDYGGWAAGAVRVGIEAIAIATDEEEPEELLEVTTEAAKMSIIGKEQAVEQVERGISRG